LATILIVWAALDSVMGVVAVREHLITSNGTVIVLKNDKYLKFLLKEVWISKICTSLICNKKRKPKFYTLPGIVFRSGSFRLIYFLQ